MSEPESFREILPEETLQIAGAIADRSAIFEQFSEKIIAELQGEPYIETPLEIKRGAHLGRTVLLMLQVEDPSRPLALKDLLDSGLSNGGYEHEAAALSKYGVEVDDDAAIDIAIDADDYKEVLSSIISGLQGDSDLLSDSQITKRFARQLEACRKTAEIHDTDVATVYRTDDFYYEAAAKAFPIHEAVNSYKELVGNASADLFEQIVLTMIDKMLPAGMASLISEDEKAEFKQELKADPEMQAMLEMQSGIMQEVVRQAALYNIVKSYGIDALADLSPEQRESILPKMPLAKEVRELVAF